MVVGCDDLVMSCESEIRSVSLIECYWLWILKDYSRLVFWWSCPLCRAVSSSSIALQHSGLEYPSPLFCLRTSWHHYCGVLPASMLLHHLITRFMHFKWVLIFCQFSGNIAACTCIYLSFVNYWYICCSYSVLVAIVDVCVCLCELSSSSHWLVHIFIMQHSCICFL